MQAKAPGRQSLSCPQIGTKVHYPVVATTSGTVTPIFQYPTPLSLFIYHTKLELTIIVLKSRPTTKTSKSNDERHRAQGIFLKLANSEITLADAAKYLGVCPKTLAVYHRAALNTSNQAAIVLSTYKEPEEKP